MTGNRKTKRAGASFESPGTLAVGGRVWPRAAAATPGPEVATLVMEMMGLEIRIQNTRGHIPAITGPGDSILPNGKYKI